MSLPFVDEHSVEITAPPEAVWPALWRVLRKVFGGTRGSRAFARAVGVRAWDPIAGYRIAEEDPGRRLVLEGEHRFARYRLAFDLEDGRLRATTHADFPGPHGKAYRLLLLPTGVHRRVVQRLLAATARAASRGTRPAA